MWAVHSALVNLIDSSTSHISVPKLAREYFEAGKFYFHRVQSSRHRLADFAYMARVEWLLDTIQSKLSVFLSA
jgi:hypothetical protein